MIKELAQKKGYIKRELKIFETKVHSKTTLFGVVSDIVVPFESLPNQKESFVLHRRSMLVILGLLAFLTLVCLIYKDDKEFDPNIWMFFLTIFLFAVPVYFYSVENLWRVRIGFNVNIFAFKKIPNTIEVDEFFELLFTTRNNYLRQTYFLPITKNLSYDSQKNNLQWLRKNEAISGIEFEKSIEELNKIFLSENNKIGFN
ncbi:hypothetical protein [Flavobacterium sp.]|uniref:hypothetical protein n=1 Tax=Flavobacterium sp. TaxID=239 RepID=UPI002632E008|nr:hypothetical protein [Flavobacterium sp.]